PGVPLDVDTAVRLAAATRRPAAPPRLGVRRARSLLRLPVVADLLERVLERGEGGAMRALTFPVGLHGAVVRLGPRPLRLRRRAPDRRRHLLAGRHPTSFRRETVAVAAALQPCVRSLDGWPSGRSRYRDANPRQSGRRGP